MEETHNHHTSEHHHSSEHHHHHHHHHHGYYEQDVNKKHVMKKMHSFLRAVKHYKGECSKEQFKMEVHRHFYDNFHGFERHWLRHHCPFIMQLRLLFLGVNIRKLH